MDLLAAAVAWYLGLGVVITYHVRVPEYYSVPLAVAAKLFTTLIWGPFLLLYWIVPSFRRWINE